MPRNFWKMILDQRRSGNCVCLELTGLPPEWDQRRLDSSRDAIYSFNRQIIDATAYGVAAYYIKLSSYLQRGLEGVVALESVLTYIHTLLSIPIIIDGMSAQGTKEDLTALFDRMKADAIVLHLPEESPILPILFERKEKGIFLLSSRMTMDIVSRKPYRNGIGLYDPIGNAREAYFSYACEGTLRPIMQAVSLVRLGEEFAQVRKLTVERTADGFTRFVKDEIMGRNLTLSQSQRFSSPFFDWVQE